MTPEQQNKNIVAEIKDLRQDISMMMDLQKMSNGKFDNHAISDAKNFLDIKVFQDRMEPFLKVFEDNQITSMTISKTTKNITFWAASVTKVAGAIAVLWWILEKVLRIKFFN